ncbi:MAG: DoxX family protein [Saprospiraceae bacterium]|nr:DoxX family protein [Saprospiraceae bacterium]
MIGLGKYIFTIPFIVFGIMHFMNAEMMAAMAPGGTIMVYIAGLTMILAAISIFVGKYDKLACMLLAVQLLLYILLVHAPGLGDAATMANSMSGLLKDTGLMGGALMAASQAKDKSVIG